MKTQIRALLGEHGLQHASALNAGLAANGCVETRLFAAADGTRALQAVLAQGVRGLGHATRLAFGGPRSPPLVSVRSGAAVTIPGMMATVLDVDLERLAFDA